MKTNSLIYRYTSKHSLTEDMQCSDSLKPNFISYRYQRICISWFPYHFLVISEPTSMINWDEVVYKIMSKIYMITR